MQQWARQPLGFDTHRKNRRYRKSGLIELHLADTLVLLAQDQSCKEREHSKYCMILKKQFACFERASLFSRRPAKLSTHMREVKLILTGKALHLELP